MGLHCLTIPNCPKSWALISWQFLLVIVLSFTTIDEYSDYYNQSTESTGGDGCIEAFK